jgi:hypothetical protein
MEFYVTAPLEAASALKTLAQMRGLRHLDSTADLVGSARTADRIDDALDAARTGRHTTSKGAARLEKIFGTKRFDGIRRYMKEDYNATMIFDEVAELGMIDELKGIVHLNKADATYDVLAHEISHVRFATQMGKWKTGQRLTNFEVNLMETIGWYTNYQKAVKTGSSRAGAYQSFSPGPMWALDTINGIRSNSTSVINSLEKAKSLYGKEFIEKALRFDGWVKSDALKNPILP